MAQLEEKATLDLRVAEARSLSPTLGVRDYLKIIINFLKNVSFGCLGGSVG